MISLEQVQLLEEKVSKAIEYVKKVNEENTALRNENLNLQKKLENNQKRIDELEVHVLRFKEDQGRIEDGIIAALDRLSQFEEAFENSLSNTKKERTITKIKHEESEETTASSVAKVQKTPDNINNEYFEIEENEESVSETELDIF